MTPKEERAANLSMVRILLHGVQQWLTGGHWDFFSGLYQKAKATTAVRQGDVSAPEALVRGCNNIMGQLMVPMSSVSTQRHSLPFHVQ